MSAVDEQCFGVRIARATMVQPDDVDAVLDFCRTQKVKMVIARCKTEDLAAAQRMEREGFLLMDTLVYFARDLTKGTLPADPQTTLIRYLRPGEAEQVRKIASLIYAGYRGHYSADPRLDRQKCDEAYISWSYNCCVSKAADEVIVMPDGPELVAFVTLHKVSDQEGNIGVGGVSPAAQGRGLYQALIVKGMEWFAEREVPRLVLSTQIINRAVQKVWCRLGFEPSGSVYTFHKWFDQL